MLLSGNNPGVSTFVQDAVTKSKTKGFTDHNKNWLKPKTPVASPVKPMENLMDDSDIDDGAVTSRESWIRVACAANRAGAMAHLWSNAARPV